MMDLSAVTVTISLAPPTSSVIAGTATRSPGLTASPCRFADLNPLIVTSSVYVSADTFGKT